MILQRLATSIRKQDWFTVLIETLIVVLGVFLGLQVNNWNIERERRAEETVYLTRLHGEVVDLLATRARIVERRAEQFVNMKSAARHIFGAEARPLTEDECASIVYNHYISNPTDDLGSLLELQSSGRTSIIQNPVVSRSLSSYLLTRSRARDSQAQISKIVFPLSPRYPNLLRITSPTQVDGDVVEQATFDCDLAGMRASRNFLNDLEVAQTTFGHHVADNARVDESLEQLKTVLDDVLGIEADEAQT